MTKIEFHNEVSRIVSKGVLKKEAFKQCFDLNSPFNTYAGYRTWKSKNGIKEPTMMKCQICNELVERKSHTQKYCSSCVPKKKSYGWNKVDQNKYTTSREPEGIGSITKLKHKINQKEREQLKLLRKVETILTRYKECNTCCELYYTHSKSDDSFCSSVCRGYIVCVDKFERDRVCSVCGSEFSKVYGKNGSRNFCSDECKNQRIKEYRRKIKRAKTHVKRAKKYGKQYEIIKRTRVFKEENYICYLCGKTTDITLPAGHKDRPTLDHVIPLSNTTELGIKYGHHTRDNVRCCCRECNTKKGVKILNRPQAGVKNLIC